MNKRRKSGSSHHVRIDGKAPKGADKDFEKLAGICEAVVCVKRIMPGEESSVIRCKANPFDLVCECKGSRKTARTLQWRAPWDRDWGSFLYKKREFSIQDIIIYHRISTLYHYVS